MRTYVPLGFLMLLGYLDSKPDECYRLLGKQLAASSIQFLQAARLNSFEVLEERIS